MMFIDESTWEEIEERVKNFAVDTEEVSFHWDGELTEEMQEQISSFAGKMERCVNRFIREVERYPYRKADACVFSAEAIEDYVSGFGRSCGRDQLEYSTIAEAETACINHIESLLKGVKERYEIQKKEIVSYGYGIFADLLDILDEFAAVFLESYDNNLSLEYEEDVKEYILARKSVFFNERALREQRKQYDLQIRFIALVNENFDVPVQKIFDVEKYFSLCAYDEDDGKFCYCMDAAFHIKNEICDFLSEKCRDFPKEVYIVYATAIVSYCNRLKSHLEAMQREKRMGKLSSDITAAEVFKKIRQGLRPLHLSICSFTITKDSRIMPLFLGYKVLAEGREDIYGMVSFNQNKRKCEISSAYPGIDENTVWTVSMKDFLGERDMDFTMSEIDDALASWMDDCERLFYLFYDTLLFNLEHHNFTDLPETEYGRFMESIKQDAREHIIVLFVLTLLFDVRDKVSFMLIVECAAVLIAFRYEELHIDAVYFESKQGLQIIRKFRKAVKCSAYYASLAAVELEGYGRIRDGFAERGSEISACSVEKYCSSLMEAGMSEEEKESMRVSEETYHIIIRYISGLND